MGVVYGLYSTRDGQVRYVGQTEYTARKCLDLVTTKALDREPGALYDWLRDEWRAEHEVRAYVVQDDIIPADLEMFETYWIQQFTGLLNVEASAEPVRPSSAIGRRVNEAILAEIRGENAID
ncbi:MAG: hypothetical protein U1E40_07210 [Amaricoccus sp.]